MKKEKFLRFSVYIIAAVLMLGMMPNSGKFLGDYREGERWNHATLKAPFDVPIFKSDAEIENDRRNAWEWQRDGGNLDDVRWYRNRRSYAVWNTNSFSIKQTLANVPNGKYALTFKGYYRDGDKDQVAQRRAAGEERLIAKYFINEERQM